jgi:hypothetical protein
MGKLIREMSDNLLNEHYIMPDDIPALMLLGELEIKDVPLEDGQVYEMKIIHYEGRHYMMSYKKKERWYENR